MKRWRSLRYPRSPKTIEEFAEQLRNNGHLLKSGNIKLDSKLVEVRNGKKHIVFYNEEFIRSEFDDVERLFIDATYKPKPKLTNSYQLLTILGIRHGHVCLS